MNLVARFLLPAVAALFIVVALMGLSLWLMERPTTQAEIERLAERLADAASTDEEPVETTDDVMVDSTPAPVRVDCAAESAYLDSRVASARACRDDLDCVISAPRQRCIAPLRVGIAGAIEDDMLRLQGACGDELRLPTLDALCAEPDRGWVPSCNDGVCELHDSFEPRL